MVSVTASEEIDQWIEENQRADASGPVRCWPEARIVGLPSRSPPDAPRVLVKRRTAEVMGPRGEALIHLPGHPTISLFTGGGGFDLGVEAAGFCVLAQHEWDPTCCETLIVNRPRAFRHAALIQGDIYQTPTSMLLREAGLRVGEADMVIGGPPCQGFSQLNPKARARGHDARNDLVYQYLRVVREAQPRFFLFENVPGFISFDGHAYLEAFLEEAYGCYYELVYGLIDAVNYGVPQRRIRFFCAGTRRDLADIEGIMASFPRPQRFERQRLTLLRAIDGSPLFREERDWLTHPPGIRYFPDRPVLIPPRPNHGGQQTKTSVEFYRKLKREEPDRIVEPGGRCP